MNVLRAALAELLGLFVDDWAFALCLAAWVGVIALVRHRLPSDIPAPLLFAGLAALTLVFVVRRASAKK